ncbi:MAG: acetolactate synthase large subunit [Gammaproteobacteria bacterium]
MKASDLFVRCLEEEKIEYVFGVPGEENADFIISLEQSDSIKFILTRHEQGAAFMAEVYGRLTGNPAACLGTLGPGATNLITGVGNGNMDRSPMLVLTGQGASTRLHKESHQVMDVVAMFTPVTKWSTTVHHADTIPEIVRKAVRLARSEKPGAIHIELCEDIAKQQSSNPPIEVQRFTRSIPPQEVVDEAFTRIAAAKKPLILAGNGVIRTHATQALREFAEASGIGVLNTFMAKGVVDMDSPQCLYTIGLGTKDVVTLAVDDADLIISCGVDLVEYHPTLWNPKCDKSIVHLDFLPAEIDAHYLPELEVVGDVAASLQMLTDKLKETPIHTSAKYQQEIREKMMDIFSQHKDDDTDGIIKPQKVLWDVRQVMGKNDILLSDVGAHKMWIARHYQCHEPNTCLVPNGFCSMGIALPGAIGASLVHPDRKILSLSGDAGFLMNVQEMETAKRLGSNIVSMIWEDHEYGLIAWKQQNEFGKHTHLKFGNPDWLKLAESFGWHGHVVPRSRDLQDVLRKAFAEEGPSLVVVPIDYRENMKLTKELGELTAQPI